MDYEKNYPITQQPGESLKVQWERGYKYVEVFHKDRLIGSVSGTGKLRTGVTLKDDLFHTIQLRLCGKPLKLDLVIDGYHSPVNQEHPVKELKGMAVWFWIICSSSILLSFIELGSLSGYPVIMAVFAMADVVIIGTYVMAALVTKRGKTWAYYVGFGMFVLVFLFNLLLMTFGATIWDFLFLAIRTGGIIILIYNMKTVISAAKHAKYGVQKNDELLDN